MRLIRQRKHVYSSPLNVKYLLKFKTKVHKTLKNHLTFKQQITSEIQEWFNVALLNSHNSRVKPVKSEKLKKPQKSQKLPFKRHKALISLIQSEIEATDVFSPISDEKIKT